MAVIIRILEMVSAVAAAVYIFLSLWSTIKGKSKFKKGQWLIVLALLLSPYPGDAACTGTSPSWTCTAATTLHADINALMGGGSFQRNDTITVTGSGTFAQTATLDISKGVTIVGPGMDNLTLTLSGPSVYINPDATSIANEHVIKITGFTWSANNTANQLMQIDGQGPSGTKPYRYVVVGNNRFKDSTTQGIFVGKQVRGVIYNNIFDRTNMMVRAFGNDAYQDQQSGTYPSSYGTADNLYLEDNSYTCSTSSSGSDPGWVEVGQGARIALRYNTWNLTNCTQQEWFDIHGQQNWSGGAGGQTGSMVVEFYGNNCIANCNGGRGINHRGGWGLFFNNTSTGSSDLVPQVNQYDNDVGGSGCNSQMPNVGGGYDGQINNSYFWNLTGNGNNTLPPGRALAGTFCGLSLNNGWWSQDTVNCTSSSCTQGIGKGTTAPTGTCTTGTAYWVASDTSVTTNSVINQAGRLYKCTSTNVWTNYYTPYTYPHPLRGSVQEPSSASGSIVIFIEWAGSLAALLWHFKKFIIVGTLSGMSLLAAGYATTKSAIVGGSYYAASLIAKTYVEYRGRNR